MKTVIAVCLLCQALGCTSVSLLENWKGPERGEDIQSLKHVLVIAYLNNDSSRTKVEQRLCSLIPGNTVPSYRYLTRDIQRSELIDQVLWADGFDGAVVLRTVNASVTSGYLPGHYPSYYYDFESFHHFAMNGYYSREHFHDDDRHSVEANVYSLRDDCLLWTGIIKKELAAKDNRVEGVAELVLQQMEKDGFSKAIVRK